MHLVIYAGASFYSFTISTLSSILAATEQETRSLQTKLSHLSDMSKYHKLPKDLYAKLHKYVKYDSKEVC